MINREQLVKLSDDLIEDWKQQNGGKKYPNEAMGKLFRLTCTQI